jgi:FkbM family methyltransferase
MGDLELRYEGTPVYFRSVSDQDHIMRAMRASGSFYESDVLEKLRGLLKDRSGAAVDAGSFIGTHSIYFAKFCGLRPVISFEANPSTFPILQHNVRRNGLEGHVLPISKALGASPGRAAIASADPNNMGSSTVAFTDNGAIEVSTIDAELARMQGRLGSVALLKIDVEGSELEVLAGAGETVARHGPVICIEVHTTLKLARVLGRLPSYAILDRLGWSPTYILARTGARPLGNALWIIRSALRRLRTKLRRLRTKTKQAVRRLLRRRFG